MENLVYQNFSNINLNDIFFDSLKADYTEFSDWFMKKANEGSSAYVLYNTSNGIEGFMYLKIEDGEVNDISPSLPNGKHLKIGTFKFESVGTRRGERFIKKMFDLAFEFNSDNIYVTVFSKHDYLMNLFQRYGFVIHGSKMTSNGIENVLTKDMYNTKTDMLENYPMVSSNSRKYLLSIYPDYHTRMLPDSILNNETYDIIQDVSHTNSIHKIYLCAAHGVQNLRRGDGLIIYRTSDRPGQAWYRSVITSLCVVEEVRSINEFDTLDDFLRYTSAYSVFTENELVSFYNSKRYPNIIRFTYNTAFKNRVTRGQLIEEGCILDERINLLEVSHSNYLKMLGLGNVNERFIIN
ncbi:N-acetyltransferase [Reinekea thalattae]|uniref:N-acetyltransferase n=1 Tax=Reinekea thalattae TaxID=2593301 RepID=A0A5C8Z9J3_9GAMM|nr:N-acetyltransferase [Reinekea thalattae]TXR54407.1 N-acetyltransferase [Reinekea thalattae]